MSTYIWQINDPELRVRRVFDLASRVFEDPDYVDAFMSGIRGHEAMAIGAPDMVTFVSAAEIAQGDRCQQLVEYLESRMPAGDMPQM